LDSENHPYAGVEDGQRQSSVICVPRLIARLSLLCSLGAGEAETSSLRRTALRSTIY
jgi:hypothetical protein